MYLSLDQVYRLERLNRRLRAWSDQTFGDYAKRGPIGPLKHLALEATEAADDSTSPEEYADCMFLWLDAIARQQSFTLEEFIAAAEAKMLVLHERSYEQVSEDGVTEHTRDE